MEDSKLKGKCRKSVSVIIPCFNEGKYVYEQIRYCLVCLSEAFENYEMILVDDGSFDETTKELERLKQDFQHVVVLHNHVNLNMGISVQRGMAVAQNEYITFNAVDLPFDPKKLRRLIEKMEDADVLVVQRREYLGTTNWRRFLSFINRGIMRICFPVVKSGIKDTNYVQIYRKKYIDKLLPFAKSPIFTWPEMIFRARYLGLRIKTVTTEYHPRVQRKGAFGKPNDILWGIYDMFRFRIKRRKWFYARE